MIEIQQLKKSLPNITDLKLLEAIQTHGKLATFKANDIIMEPGIYIKSVPILISGSIKILREDQEGKEVFLYYLDPGDTCAISLTCCSAYKPSEVKAIVEEPATLLFIPVQLHEQWTNEFKQWKEFVSMTYQKRFQELLKVVDEIAFRKMDERLLSYLAKKARQSDSQDIKITHQDIAKELGTSREVISRLLKQLENDGVVSLGRNLITLEVNYEEII
jgi:CRP/FNR family transcriptional regulator, anaerobic regulatory protein